MLPKMAAAVRLAQLDGGGPRPLRTMWRLVREPLQATYGQMTIGELLDRYGKQPPAAG